MDNTQSLPLLATPIRIALALIAGGACAVGLSPYLIFVDQLAYAWAPALAAAATAGVALRGFETASGAPPSLGEWLLGGWSAVSMPATGSLTSLALYGIFYGCATLFGAAARGLDWTVHVDPTVVGYWGSIWFALLSVLAGATAGFQAVARKLYPHEAWARSPFLPLLNRPPRVAAVALGVVLLAAGASLWLDVRGVALPVLLALLCFYTSFPLAELGSIREDRPRSEVIDALVASLQAAAYRVTRAPRTGKQEIDPLLQSVELLARREGHALAIEVKSVPPGRPVEWHEASAIRTAALLLSQECEHDGEPDAVEPLLVLVGGKPAQSLLAFSQRERVPVVHFDAAAEATDDRATLDARLAAAGVPLTAAAPTAADRDALDSPAPAHV